MILDWFVSTSYFPHTNVIRITMYVSSWRGETNRTLPLIEQLFVPFFSVLYVHAKQIAWSVSSLSVLPLVPILGSRVQWHSSCTTNSISGNSFLSCMSVILSVHRGTGVPMWPLLGPVQTCWLTKILGPPPNPTGPVLSPLPLTIYRGPFPSPYTGPLPSLYRDPSLSDMLKSRRLGVDWKAFYFPAKNVMHIDR